MESIIKKLGKASITVEKDYHSSEKEYNKLTIVEEEGTFKTYLSRKPVPIGTELTNREYWIPFSGVLESITFDYLKFKRDYASGNALDDNSIITRHILDRNIERIKIALKAISEEEIDDNAIIERTIKDRNVTSNKIAKENILTEHLAKKSIITDILTDYAVTAIKLADNSVTTRSIVNENVTQEKLSINIQSLISNLSKTATFSGIATPTTNPGIPTAKTFYIAIDKGIYNNFNGIEVTEDEIVILYFDTTWHKKTTGIAPKETLIKLKEKVDSLALGTFYGFFPDSSSLPIDITTSGYAYVGLDTPYKIWNFNGESWSDSGTSIDMNDADEEDITRNTDGKLQFKNKEYGDGMGYVILRKNKSFAEQVTKENTIYEIRYNFILNENITIPTNCVLKFNGGSISGAYIITGNNTSIVAERVKIISLDTVLDGTWVLMDWAYPEQFGATGDGITNDTRAFKNCLVLSNNVRTKAGNYLIWGVTDIKRYENERDNPGIWIAKSDVTMIFDDGAKLIKTGVDYDTDHNMFYEKAIQISGYRDITGQFLTHIKNVKIIGGEFVGNRHEFVATRFKNLETSSAISIFAENVLIKDCYIHDWQCDSIICYVSKNVVCENIRSEHARRTGFSIGTVENFVMDGCTSTDDGQDVTYDSETSSGTLPADCVCFESDDHISNTRPSATIKNCTFNYNGNKGYAITVGTGAHGNKAMFIDNCMFNLNSRNGVHISAGEKGIDDIVISNCVFNNNNNSCGISCNSYTGNKTIIKNCVANNKLIDINTIDAVTGINTLLIENCYAEKAIINSAGSFPAKEIIIRNNIVNDVSIIHRVGGKSWFSSDIIIVEGNVALGNISPSSGVFLNFIDYDRVAKKIIIRNNECYAPAELTENRNFSFLTIGKNTSSDILIKNNKFESSIYQYLNNLINGEWELFPGIIDGNIFKLPAGTYNNIDAQSQVKPTYITNNIFIGTTIPITNETNPLIIKQNNVVDAS